MEKKELILLDATLTGVLHARAFRAVLDNGHPLVAYLDTRATAPDRELGVGCRVRVLLSPFDMSNGRMVFDDRQDGI